jgi:palmitoyl-protein thioesterase|tara:strand:- start:68 stop:325 length:258 start_codon:yes stop_codon:yes gene_type:complete
MLVEFDKDEIVYPRNSEIFGEVTKKDADGKRKKVDMEDTEIYKNDWLGLKYLQEHGKIKMVHIDAQHIKYGQEDIEKTFLPFLRQ